MLTLSDEMLAQVTFLMPMNHKKYESENDNTIGHVLMYFVAFLELANEVTHFKYLGGKI